VFLDPFVVKLGEYDSSGETGSSLNLVVFPFSMGSAPLSEMMRVTSPRIADVTTRILPPTSPIALKACKMHAVVALAHQYRMA
jgi:hypothetical protein